MLQQTWTSCMIHRIPYFLQTLFSCFGFFMFCWIIFEFDLWNESIA
jgi:hypothetical protein